MANLDLNPYPQDDDSGSALDKRLAIAIAGQIGARGSKLISDTAVHTGPFFALKARGGDAVIDAVTISSGSGTGSDWLNGETLSDGEMEYGPFETVKLTSGTVVAYYR